MAAMTYSTGAPTVSILCLTYNHAAFVAQALESFLAQDTSFEVELVIGDDCSTDNTLQVIETYRARFGPSLRVLPAAANMGVTRNFRRTYRACRGRYIAICEGDDFWRGSSKLQTQVDFLESHPAFVMAFHDATIVDAQGERTEIQQPRQYRRDASQADLLATRPISTLTVCMRKVLDDLPPELDHAPALDLCLWSLLGSYGQGKYLPQVQPAGYRVHGAGVFSSQTDRNRHLMTAQSLLCLARIYARQGQQEASDVVLLKAIALAGVPLPPSAAFAALRSLLFRLAVSCARAAKRLFSRVRQP
jgi:hypothetical protein